MFSDQESAPSPITGAGMKIRIENIDDDCINEVLNDTIENLREETTFVSAINTLSISEPQADASTLPFTRKSINSVRIHAELEKMLEGPVLGESQGLPNEHLCLKETIKALFFNFENRRNSENDCNILVRILYKMHIFS